MASGNRLDTADASQPHCQSDAVRDEPLEPARAVPDDIVERGDGIRGE